MPIYEFKCDKCGHVTEQIVPMKDAKEKIKCEKCNEEAKRIISNTTFWFK